MRYDVQFKPAAVKDLKSIPARTQSRIVAKIETMSDDLKGDVKRLTDFTREYRLRVGDYRVLFEIEGKSIMIIVSAIDAIHTDKGDDYGHSESSDHNKEWEEGIRDHPLCGLPPNAGRLGGLRRPALSA